jgi:hypothetical protein
LAIWVPPLKGLKGGVSARQVLRVLALWCSAAEYLSRCRRKSS